MKNFNQTLGFWHGICALYKDDEGKGCPIQEVLRQEEITEEICGKGLCACHPWVKSVDALEEVLRAEILKDFSARWEVPVEVMEEGAFAVFCHLEWRRKNLFDVSPYSRKIIMNEYMDIMDIAEKEKVYNSMEVLEGMKGEA